MRRFFQSLLFFSFGLLATTEIFACTIDAKTLDKNSLPVKAIPGQWVLVQAWTLDCAVCEQQKPELSALNDQYKDFTSVTLSLDGISKLDQVKQRVNLHSYSFDHYITELNSFRDQLKSECFSTDYVGTPTYILYSPSSEVAVVRTGPIDLASLPAQLKLRSEATVNQELMR